MARLLRNVRANWVAAVALAAALPGVAWSQQGASSGVTLTSTTPGGASFSRSLTDQGNIRQAIAFANVGQNVVNDAYLLLQSTTNAGALTLVSSAFGGNKAINCYAYTVVPGYSVRCDVGQFRPGENVSIELVYATPVIPAVAVTDPQANLNVQANYAESTSDQNAARTDQQIVVAAIPLSNPNLANKFESTVTANVARIFFTGKPDTVRGGGFTEDADPWTTTVSLPALSLLAQTRAQEADSPIFRSSQLPTEFSTDFTLVDTSLTPQRVNFCPGGVSADCPNFIEVTLRRDLSAIKNGTKIENITFYYQKDATKPVVEIQKCSLFDAINLRPVKSGDDWVPCLYSATIVPFKRTANRKSDGYVEAVFRAYENGRYIN